MASSILAKEKTKKKIPVPPTRTADYAVKGLEVALGYYKHVRNKVKTLQSKSLIRDAKMRVSKTKKQADITSYFSRK